MGKCQQKNVWLFVHAMRVLACPVEISPFEIYTDPETFNPLTPGQLPARLSLYALLLRGG